MYVPLRTDTAIVRVGGCVCTSEDWCQNCGDDTASVDGEIEEREEMPSRFFLHKPTQDHLLLCSYTVPTHVCEPLYLLSQYLHANNYTH